MLGLKSEIMDALRSLFASLQLPMLLPAVILVGGVLWLVSPEAFLNNQVLLIALVFVVITVSYLFNAFNYFFNRLLEGYVWKDSWLMQEMRDYQLQQYYQHRSEASHCKEQIIRIQEKKDKIYIENRALLYKDIASLRFACCKECVQNIKHEVSREIERDVDVLTQYEDEWKDFFQLENDYIRTNYPPKPTRILPTRFGNVMAMFEWYSQTRYCINGAQLWTRFVPVLMEKEYVNSLRDAKMLLDFLVNLTITSMFLWFIALFTFGYTGRADAGLLVLTLPLCFFIFYYGACAAVSRWGDKVNVAFDLYRGELKKALHLTLPFPTNMAEERKMWETISEFIRGNENAVDNFDGFDYQEMYC